MSNLLFKRRERRKGAKSKKLVNSEIPSSVSGTATPEIKNDTFESDLDYLLANDEKDFAPPEYVMVDSFEQLEIGNDESVKEKNKNLKGFSIDDITKDIQNIDFSTDEEDDQISIVRKSGIEKIPRQELGNEIEIVHDEPKSVNESKRQRKPRNRHKGRNQKESNVNEKVVPDREKTESNEKSEIEESLTQKNPRKPRFRNRNRNKTSFNEQTKPINTSASLEYNQDLQKDTETNRDQNDVVTDQSEKKRHRPRNRRRTKPTLPSDSTESKQKEPTTIEKGSKRRNRHKTKSDLSENPASNPGENNSTSIDSKFDSNLIHKDKISQLNSEEFVSTNHDQSVSQVKQNKPRRKPRKRKESTQNDQIKNVQPNES